MELVIRVGSLEKVSLVALMFSLEMRVGDSFPQKQFVWRKDSKYVEQRGIWKE